MSIDKTLSSITSTGVYVMAIENTNVIYLENQKTAGTGESYTTEYYDLNGLELPAQHYQFMSIRIAVPMD